MKPRNFDWHNTETGEHVASTEDDKYWDIPPRCPSCLLHAEYWEGQVDQDFMGNDIYGWNWTCYPCGVSTQMFDLHE